MKKIVAIVGLLITVALTYEVNAQNIAVNEDGSTPDGSALMDMKSSNKGLLTPRMNTAEMNAISSPAKGLLIYNTQYNYFMVNTGTPSVPAWTPVGGQSGGAPDYTFETGSTGTDFNIETNGTENIFHIPSASATARGLVTTGTQTIGGKKTFADSLIAAGGFRISSILGGSANDSLLTIGSNGTVSRRRIADVLSGTAISSLNGLTTSTQTFNTGSSGTDFAISSSSGVHTFNIPSASTTARGLITTGTQTIGGKKTFQDSLTVSSGLKLSSVASGASTDSVLTINAATGLVTKRTSSDFISGAGFFSPVSTSTITTSTFSNTSFNTTNLINLTIPSAGTYLVLFTGNFSATGNKQFSIQMYSGSTAVTSSLINTQTASTGVNGAATHAYLASLAGSTVISIRGKSGDGTTFTLANAYLSAIKVNN